MLLKDLSPRQRELIRYLADGHSDAEIGTLMGISIFTVKNMLNTLRERTGSSNRHTLVLHFYRIVRRIKKDVLPMRVRQTNQSSEAV